MGLLSLRDFASHFFSVSDARNALVSLKDERHRKQLVPLMKAPSAPGRAAALLPRADISLVVVAPLRVLRWGETHVLLEIFPGLVIDMKASSTD